jgi:hypothetical protein
MNPVFLSVWQMHRIGVQVQDLTKLTGKLDTIPTEQQVTVLLRCWSTACVCSTKSSGVNLAAMDKTVVTTTVAPPPRSNRKPVAWSSAIDPWAHMWWIGGEGHAREAGQRAAHLCGQHRGHVGTPIDLVLHTNLSIHTHDEKDCAAPSHFVGFDAGEGHVREAG